MAIKKIPAVTPEMLEHGHQKFREHCAATNPNSMLIWWPKIKDLGIPVPRTEFISISREDVMPAAIGEDVELPQSVLDTFSEVERTADSFGYPVFMRSDVSSAKHDWKNTCYIANREAIRSNILTLCGGHELWDLLGINYKAIAIREFLPLETAFTAFYGEMPINKEFRFFVKNGEVACYHFYWPEEAFNQHPARMAHCPDWKEKLAELSKLRLEDFKLLSEYARTVGKECAGFWSVDFAKSTNGRWYLIDMAVGENSFHWPGCDKIG